MKKIQYHYTNIAKQAFLAVCFLYVLLRFVVMLQIVIYKIDGYYEATNIPLTLLLYAALFAVVIALFMGHKFCFSQYDETHLVYTNKLLRRSKALTYADAKAAVFGTFGVKFYAESDFDEKSDKPIFSLPFFRDGIIEAVQIDRFYKMLKADENIRVVKKFQVLPGYSKKWKVLAIVYAFLAVALLANCSTPLTVIIVLFQAH